jgi:tRNA(fMet)-specific endonuclease VapC
MYLLDTNTCIAIIKDNPQVIKHFRNKYQDCYLSSLVIAELYKGVFYSTKIEYNLNIANQFISKLSIVDFNSDDALEFGKIQGEFKKIGKPTGVVDALIAGIARNRNYILVTDNTKHFINIPNLQLENWLLK